MKLGDALLTFKAIETLDQARKRLAKALTAAGKEPAFLESRLLLEEATGLSSLELLSQSEMRLGRPAAAALRELAARRFSGEPLSRILGRSAFYGLNLGLSPDVLDPRSDTETLVDKALSVLEEKKIAHPRILDLGTGSGAILCALLDSRPDAFGVGLDISPAACALARKNLAHCGLSDRSSVIRGDWTQSVRGQFDLIVSNPPYIAQWEMMSLEREVVAFDPLLALAGGADGLDSYRRIAHNLSQILRSGGVACFEIGWRQAADVSQILSEAGLGGAQIFQDRGLRDRVIVVEAQ